MRKKIKRIGAVVVFTLFMSMLGLGGSYVSPHAESIQKVEAKTKKITKARAKKGVKNYIKEKEGTDQWYFCGTDVSKKKYTIWVKYNTTGVWVRFVVSRKTGKTKYYGFYLANGYGTKDYDKTYERLGDTFSIYKYL